MSDCRRFDLDAHWTDAFVPGLVLFWVFFGGILFVSPPPHWIVKHNNKTLMLVYIQRIWALLCGGVFCLAERDVSFLCSLSMRLAQNFSGLYFSWVLGSLSFSCHTTGEMHYYLHFEFLFQNKYADFYLKKPNTKQKSDIRKDSSDIS